MHARTKYLTILILFLVGCKSGQTESTAKTNRTVADAFEVSFTSLDPVQRDSICSVSTMVTFVGNGESMGVASYAGRLPNNVKERLQADDLKAKTELYKLIRQSADDMTEAFANNRCPPSADVKLFLLKILDGPDGNDSFIELVSYGWRGSEWLKTDVKALTFTLAGGLAEPNGAAFELNLPSSVAVIAKQVFDTYVRNGRIVYIFKSHGGKVAIQQTTLPKLSETEQVFADNIPSKPVFLMDTHGEGGVALRSNLYTAGWVKESACSIYESLNLRDKATASGCYASSNSPTEIPVLSTNNGTLGTSNGTLGTSNGTLGTSNGTLGTSNGTLGTSNGTLGTSNGTLGTSNGTLGTSNGTLGTSNGTLGTSNGTLSTSNGTLGTSNGTLGGSFPSGTLGGGKKFMMTGALPALSTEVSDASPDLVVQMGEVATYDPSYSADGVSKLKLFVGNAPADQARLVILDSCYGSDLIGSAGMAQQVSEDSSVAVPVVTIFSRLPAYLYSARYKFLSAHLINGLPQLALWSEGAAAANTILRDRASAFINEQARVGTVSIIDALSNPTPTDIAKYREQHPDITDFNPDYLRFQLSVNVIEGRAGGNGGQQR